MRNLCAQYDTVAELKKCQIVTRVCVNAIRAILQFTLVTHGHLFRVRLGVTKGTYIPIITHNILIIIVLLCRCGPYMCRYVFPRTIWRVPYLSLNQKLLQMQEYTHTYYVRVHVLMQFSTGSPPYVPHNAPMPHACKQVLNTCPVETMHIVVFRAEMVRHPCILGGPQTKGDKIRTGCLNPAFSGPRRGRKCYVTPAFSGVPKQRGGKIRIGCLTPAFSRAQKRAELLRNPCVLGGPQAKGDKIGMGYFTLAFLAGLTQPRKEWMW